MNKNEIEFHNSRVAWAIINNRIYFTICERGHKEWLIDEFNITEKRI